MFTPPTYTARHRIAAYQLLRCCATVSVTSFACIRSVPPRAVAAVPPQVAELLAIINRIKKLSPSVRGALLQAQLSYQLIDPTLYASHVTAIQDVLLSKRRTGQSSWTYSQQPAAASRVSSGALCRLLTVVHSTNGIEAEHSNAKAMHQSPALSFPGPGAAQCSKTQRGQDQTQRCCACVPYQQGQAVLC